MNKFNTMSTLLQFLSIQPYPDELTSNIVLAMHHVEQCNKNSDNSSFVIIAESKTDLKEVESKYDLNNCYPEVDEYITANNQRWRKRVYVFDDYGNGIVLYSPSSSDNEKRTE